MTSPILNPPPHFHSLSFDPLPIYYSDSYVVSSYRVVKQSDPTKYSTSIQPLNKETICSASDDAPTKLQFGKLSRVPKKKRCLKALIIPNKSSMSQRVWCELCKIECNNVQVYEKHLSGKKHIKCLLNLYAPTLQSAAAKTAGSGGQGVAAAPSKTTDLEVKKKKLLEGGTAIQSLRICAICNVACNGEVVFSDHVAGKKHIAKMKSAFSQENGWVHQSEETSAQSNQTKKRKNGESSLAWCDVCKISCTSSDGLNTHLSGKKHQKNVQKLQGEGTTSVTKTFIPESSRGQSEDVNMKKQKVVECGATAACVRTCVICNVVCNSETVFQSHLGGQKHAAMVKQAQVAK